MESFKKFNVIVAACKNGGIGLNGGIPWNLKGDLRHFARLTTTTQNPEKKNAVVMGRKTWLSIPEKFRPLKDRINVVVSQTLTSLSPPTYQVSSVEDALKLMSTPPLADQIETVWIIGGQSLYQHALGSPNLDKVYFTNILKDYECDAFFSVSDLQKMKRTKDDSVEEGEMEENGVPYRFEVYSTA